MRNRAYVERICRELLARGPHQVEEEMRSLIEIFERIQNLPSPEKEERFVSLLFERHLNRSSTLSSDAVGL